MRRRSVLAGVAGAASLAGCLGGSRGGAGDGGSGDGGSADGSDTSGGGRERGVYAAMETLDGQPFVGAPPRDASKLVVAFEDPTCYNCRRFHETVLGDLRSQLIQPDAASLVWRPWRYTNAAWQTQAINAALAATDRSNAAGWRLVQHYYDTQSEYETANVSERTRSFLASETDVDADAVVADAEDRAYQSLLETSESEGDEAGVTSTPTFLLFEDGTHRTTIEGVQDAELFVAAFEA